MVLTKSLHWKEPQLFNIEALHHRNDGSDEQIYVIPAFLKPGRNLLVAALPDEQYKTPVYYVTRLLNLKREEEIKVIQKKLKVIQINRHFEKHNSVFKDWIQDTDETTDWIYNHDARYWKVNRFIRDEEDLVKTHLILKQNIPLLSQFFIEIISRSNSYPNLGFLDFSENCQKLGFVDKKKISLAKLDIIFTQVNADHDGDDYIEIDNKKLMIRYEFFEALVRLAGLMYKDTKITKTYAEAFQNFISEIIEPNYDWAPGQEWRDLELWNLEINDLFHANLDYIRRIWVSYFTPSKKFFSKDDAH